MEFQLHTLPNGVRLVHKQVDSAVAHAGVMMHTGSRDESEEEQGMAHFIEHVIFKGTKKRKAYHIISRIEDVGGELNAYTAKEETCIYASFLKEDYNRSLELFSDILFNSVFPEKELLKEKDVIYDEINSYKDSPSELIFDDFEELVFKNHPLGMNILGTPKHLESFSRTDVMNFFRNTYYTDEMIVCSVGNINFKKLVKLFEKYFSDVNPMCRSKFRKPFTGYTQSKKVVEKDTHQTHCIVGNVAYNVHDDRRTGLFLLNNILAGPGMNSRLNMSLREKYGYAYNVEASYTPYSDAGLFSIYFGTDNNYFNKSLAIIHSEIRLLQQKKLGILQLSKAKKQLAGQLAIADENLSSQMLGIGKSYLVFNHCETLDEVNKRIEAITSEQIREIANDVLAIDKLSTLIYQ